MRSVITRWELGSTNKHIDETLSHHRCSHPTPVLVVPAQTSSLHRCPAQGAHPGVPWNGFRQGRGAQQHSRNRMTTRASATSVSCPVQRSRASPASCPGRNRKDTLFPALPRPWPAHPRRCSAASASSSGPSSTAGDASTLPQSAYSNGNGNGLHGSHPPPATRQSSSFGAASSGSDSDSSSAYMSDSGHTGSPEAGEVDRGNRPIWPRGTLTAVILGGGVADNRRLFPLTQHRTLPALPFGGAYRLIDLLMSNLINSGINKIHILTAYNSYSLNRHLQRTYDMSSGVPFGGDGYVEVVANSLSPDTQMPVTGTAAAVRQFMTYFDSNTKNRFIEDVLVLPGDHVYNADLTPVVAYHRTTGADLTIACRPCTGQQASQLGVVKLDPKAGPNSCRISGFAEKPAQEELAGMAMSDEDLVPFMQQQLREAERREAERGAAERRARQRRGQVLAVEEELEMAGRRAARAAAGRVNLETRGSIDEVELLPGMVGYVGSTGIYIFRRHVLSEVLAKHSRAVDFGRQIIPEIIREGYKVQAYRLPGYWADVGGCVGDFYTANMALLGDPPSVALNTPPESPWFRYPRTVPATQMYGTRVSRSLVSAGCILADCTISHSIIGMRSTIGSGVTVADSVVMGASHYEHEKPQARPHSATYPHLGIGSGSVVRRAILDLNCRIGSNVRLVNAEGVFESTDRAAAGIYIRDGVIVLARETVVPDGTVL